MANTKQINPSEIVHTYRRGNFGEDEKKGFINWVCRAYPFLLAFLLQIIAVGWVIYT